VSRFAPSEKTEPLRDAPSFNLNFDNPQTSDIEVLYTDSGVNSNILKPNKLIVDVVDFETFNITFVILDQNLIMNLDLR
jgi:hypothetical protein